VFGRVLFFRARSALMLDIDHAGQNDRLPDGLRLLCVQTGQSSASDSAFQLLPRRTGRWLPVCRVVSTWLPPTGARSRRLKAGGGGGDSSLAVHRNRRLLHSLLSNGGRSCARKTQWCFCIGLLSDRLRSSSCSVLMALLYVTVPVALLPGSQRPPSHGRLAATSPRIQGSRGRNFRIALRSHAICSSIAPAGDRFCAIDRSCRGTWPTHNAFPFSVTHTRLPTILMGHTVPLPDRLSSFSSGQFPGIRGVLFHRPPEPCPLRGVARGATPDPKAATCGAAEYTQERRGLRQHPFHAELEVAYSFSVAR